MTIHPPPPEPGFLEDNLQRTFDAGVAAGAGAWRCFHCDELFTDRKAAEDHFGDEGVHSGPAACVQVLTETERAIVEDRRMWRNRALCTESELEQAQCELSSLQWAVREIIRKAAKRQGDDGRPRELRWVWETMEGRYLAAEAALDALPKWLRQWARRAERLWKRKSRK